VETKTENFQLHKFVLYIYRNKVCDNLSFPYKKRKILTEIP